jgi:hypothetical protein
MAVIGRGPDPNAVIDMDRILGDAWPSSACEPGSSQNDTKESRTYVSQPCGVPNGRGFCSGPLPASSNVRQTTLPRNLARE